jgi:hypothetical protein
MVEAIEEEGDRAYFGSTNDADRLKEIAAALDDWRFNLPQSAAASPDADLVERVARAIEREFYACVDEGPPQGVGFERVARAAIKALTAIASRKPFVRSKEWWMERASAEPDCIISAGVPDDRDALWSCQQLAATGIEATDDSGPLAEIFAEIHRTAAAALASKSPPENLATPPTDTDTKGGDA